MHIDRRRPVAFVLATVGVLLLNDPARAGDMPAGSDRWRLDAEALWWTINNAPQPTPLATSGSITDRLPGALGQPGTSVRIGGASVSLPFQPGGRFTLGGWIDREAGLAAEVGGFFLAPGSARQSVATDGMPGSSAYTVPLFDISGYTSGGTPGETLYVLPGPFPNGPGFAGKMQRTITSRLAGMELTGVLPLHESGRLRVQGLAGYRWLRFDEDLSFVVQTAGVLGSSNAGQMFNSEDQFRTRNNFHGLQIGVRGQYEFDRLTMHASLKGALGVMRRTLTIDGASSTTAGTIFFPVGGGRGGSLGGGIFAQPSNIGSHGSDRFAGVVEVGARVGYRVTDWLTSYVGYDMLYAASVLRPGDSVNRAINTTDTALAAVSRASGHASPIGGPAGPTVKTGSSNLLVHGVSVGLSVRF